MGVVVDERDARERGVAAKVQGQRFDGVPLFADAEAVLLGEWEWVWVWVGCWWCTPKTGGVRPSASSSHPPPFSLLTSPAGRQ